MILVNPYPEYYTIKGAAGVVSRPAWNCHLHVRPAIHLKVDTFPFEGCFLTVGENLISRVPSYTFLVNLLVSITNPRGALRPDTCGRSDH